MGRELIAAFDAADADDDVRAMIVTGAGRGYCAGADLAAGGDDVRLPRARRGRRRVPRDGGGRFTLRMFESHKPVIAAINGPAVGVGATMTLPMDIRLAADDAQDRLRLRPPRDRPRGLLELVPAARRSGSAARWSGSRPGACSPPHEALDGGLVRSLHQRDELLDAAHALAREIAENTAPVSVALARRMMWRCSAPSIRCGRTAPTRGGCSRAASPPTPRGRRVVPREAPGRVPRPGQRRPAGHLPAWAEPAFQ